MFGEKILDYWDDIMKDLGDIVAIPSVAQPQDGPYPFGKDAATAVDKAIEIAERYGIKTKNSDYARRARRGRRKRRCYGAP